MYLFRSEVVHEMENGMAEIGRLDLLVGPLIARYCASQTSQTHQDLVVRARKILVQELIEARREPLSYIHRLMVGAWLLKLPYQLFPPLEQEMCFYFGITPAKREDRLSSQLKESA